MIKIIEEYRLLVCEKCGMKLNDKPRFSFHEHIYCYRCAKKETIRAEGIQYEEKRQLHKKQEILSKSIIEQYDIERRKWESNRYEWVHKNGMTFGRFMFFYCIVIIVLIAIKNVFLIVISVIFGIPLWSYIHDQRKQKLQKEYSYRLPPPIAPSFNIEKPTLKELDDLKIVFFDSEWDVINSNPRNKILKRDRNTCQSCGESKPNKELEVHHVLPKNYGGPNCDANLITLCLRCHDHEYWFRHVRMYPTTFAKDIKRRIIRKYIPYD